MNTLDQPVTIQSGQQYGKVTLTCDVNEAHSFQARLPTIRPGLLPPLLTLTNATLRAPYWRLEKSLGRHLLATVRTLATTRGSHRLLRS
jgi:hypothetical protein